MKMLFFSGLLSLVVYLVSGLDGFLVGWLAGFIARSLKGEFQFWVEHYIQYFNWFLRELLQSGGTYISIYLPGHFPLVHHLHSAKIPVYLHTVLLNLTTCDCIALHCTVLLNTVLNYSIVHLTAWYSTELWCTTLHSNALNYQGLARSVPHIYSAGPKVTIKY